MMNLLKGLLFMGFIIGVASIAGSIELEQSPVAAIVLSVISIILLVLSEKLEDIYYRRRRNARKNNFRIY